MNQEVILHLEFTYGPYKVTLEEPNLQMNSMLLFHGCIKNISGLVHVS